MKKHQVLVVASLVMLFGFRSAIADDTVDNETLSTQIFGNRHHVRSQGDTAIYYAPRVYRPDGASYGDNSTGFRISEADPEKFAQAFSEFIAQTQSQTVEGDFLVTGQPMWDRTAAQLMVNLREQLNKMGVDPSKIKVKAMYKPMGKGIKGALERLRYFFPMPQDYEVPIQTEIMVGLPGVIGSEVTTAGYALAAFPPALSIPMLAGHFGLLGSMTAFRRTMSNWFNRGGSALENVQVGNISLNNLDRQAATSLMFIVNYNIASGGFDQGVGHFMTQQGVTTFTQTLFFWLTFSQGVYRWEAVMAQDPEKSQLARKLSSVVAPGIFWVTGPLLAWASTSQDVLFNLAGTDINPGQVALAGAAVVGAIFARPWALTPAAKWYDKTVLGTYRVIRSWFTGESPQPVQSKSFVVNPSACEMLL